jgi:PAT family beta-lactamase induction signal transducer AmpG
MPGYITIYLSIALEQFGYGFGFTAYMLYMLHYVGESKYKTAEYAIGTSLMALGMMLPGMISGSMKEILGYRHFFIYVILCSIPGLIALKFLKIDPGFGIKTKVK